jgi:hypothetical protein
MTLWAKRSDANPQNIEIRWTGQAEFKVIEHQEHVKHFWSELGDLLRQEEEKDKT